MASRVEFLPDAAREFDALDGSLKKVAAKQIDKLAEQPELGEPWGKRMGIDLTGYRKSYLGKKVIGSSTKSGGKDSSSSLSGSESVSERRCIEKWLSGALEDPHQPAEGVFEASPLRHRLRRASRQAREESSRARRSRSPGSIAA